jgi:hypothetical protein
MLRLPNAIDFWRGFALVTIFINHIPGLFYERLTYRNVSVSDSAELFVFLAGWSLRIVISKQGEGVSTDRLISRLGGRALKIYAAHVLIVGIAIAMLAAAALMLDNPLILEWHNAAAVFYDPVETHIGLMLLTHQLGYFNILPLYVVLMACAPVLALIDRHTAGGLLPASLALYLLTLVVPITVPSWPVEGQWFFNPLAWQFIFVLGFILAKGNSGPGAFVRHHIGTARAMAVPMVAASALVVLFDWWPDPVSLPEPRLLFINGKTFLTPIRVTQFLALVAVFSAAYPYLAAVMPRLADFLSMLGRNSLYVFCVGSVASLLGQILRFVLGGGFAVDTILLVSGLAVMGATAWVAEWQERSRARAPVTA